MIISTYLEENSYLHSHDEKKLLAIEKEENIIYTHKSDFNNISILESSIGRILLFDDTYQGGSIKYNNFIGGMPYTRYYHLAKTINADIKDILVLGLGSGSVVKDCTKIYDYNSIDIIDIDPAVIDVAYNYFDLPKHNSINVHCEDARDFVFYTNKLYDLIIVDVFVAKGMPFKFMTHEFIQQAYNILNPNGVIGVNLFGTENMSDSLNDIFKAEYKTYQEVFNSLYTFPVLYGSFEFFRYSCDLRYEMGKLTNNVLLSSKSKEILNKTDFMNQAKKLTETTKVSYLKNYCLYARDMIQETINTENYAIIKDSLDSNKEINNDSFLNKIKQ